MQETELERLIIRLVGDGSDYQKMLTTAVSSTQQTAAQVQGLTGKIQGYGTGLQSFARSAISALAIFGIATSLKGAFDAYTQLERSQIRLSAAIEAGGHTVASTLKEYDAFMKTMVSTTLVTKGNVRAMLEQAEAQGFSGKEAEEVVKTSISLAKGNGDMAQSYLRVAVMMQRGHPEFAKRILGLQGITDKTELAKKVQDRLASGMKVAQADFNSTGGQVERLGRSLRGLAADVGGIIATVLLPVINWLQQAADWFNALDPIVKKFSVGILAVLTALIGMGPVLSIIAPAISAIGAVVGVVFSPWIILIGVVIGLLAIIVKHLGGLQATWDLIKGAGISAWTYIKEKGQEFMDWAQPIWDALASLASAAWEEIEYDLNTLWEFIKDTFTAVKDWILKVWDDITGGSTVDWERIRSAIQDAIIFAEFTVRHFGDVWKFISIGAVYEFIRFTNQVEYFFKTVIPAVLDWFADNWRTIFTDMWSWTTNMLADLAGNIVNLIAALPDLISGKTHFEDIWVPLGQTFQRATKELIIPAREADLLESQLKTMYEKQAAALGTSFAEFRAAKLAEFAAKGLISPEGIKEAEKAGKDLGKAVTKGAKEEFKKLEGVLSFSAEALSHILEYRERITNPPKTPGSTEAAKGPEAPKKFEAVLANSAEAESREKEILTVNKQSRDLLARQAKIPPVILRPAGLT